MKYALLIYSEPGAIDRPPTPVHDGIIDNWTDYTVAMKKAGVTFGAEQLRPADTATTVTAGPDERLLTDGPLMETKEHLLGFYLVDVPDLDTALDWAARMPIMRYGTVEVRPVMEGQAWQAGLK